MLHRRLIRLFSALLVLARALFGTQSWAQPKPQVFGLCESAITDCIEDARKKYETQLNDFCDAPGNKNSQFLCALNALGKYETAKKRCRATDGICDISLVCCNGRCVDTASDRANCGGCARTCESGETCWDGRCQCPQGLTKCGSLCTNTQSDNANCGSCGSVCAGGRYCVLGTCICPAGETPCADGCKNPSSDRKNCGACGSQCPGKADCIRGFCKCTQSSICPPGTHWSLASCSCESRCGRGLKLCAGACVDVKMDSNNCGRCNKRCGSGQSCKTGICECNSGLKPACGGKTCCQNVCPSTGGCLVVEESGHVRCLKCD
jgi:hypothetical protein